MTDNMQLIVSWKVNVPDSVIKGVAQLMDAHPEFAYSINDVAPRTNKYCLLAVHGRTGSKKHPCIDISAYGNEHGKPVRIVAVINNK